jgi:uncharacterized protein (TIGR00269 family)
MKCRRCAEVAQVALPSHNTGFCPDCFFEFFSRQVERAIKDHRMADLGERILVCLSGGKDSLSLMDALARLGYDVTGLHVYLGIPGSSDAALSICRKFCEARGYPLEVADMPAAGLAIPDVKQAINRPICSACGKIKRHAFNAFAREHGFHVLATGHNLDDETARLFANTLRWDVSHLGGQGPCLEAEEGFVRKVKPLCRLTEFETASYAFLRGIAYGCEPCPYSTGASFTGHKDLLEQLEERSPGSKYQFYDNFLRKGRPVFAEQDRIEGAVVTPCERCGSPTSQEQCGVCRIREAVAGARV